MSEVKPGTTPRLSLCVITKDEEANLPRCLRSVRGLVDEVVVTDTGSTDRTLEIARASGARVVSFAWCDDFSAAYNQGLAHARSEWVLILDADEELEADSLELVRSLLDRDEAFAYSLLRRDYFGEEVRDEAQSEMRQTRLVRRRDNVRFVGRIHQQLEPSLSVAAYAEGRRVIASDVRIRHYGYMGDHPTRKLDRSIRLLEMELEDRPDQFYYLVELGRSKLRKGDASGMEQLRRAAEKVVSGEEPIGAGAPMVQLLLEQLLSIDELPLGFPINHEQMIRIANASYGDSIPIRLQIARRRFREKEFAEAASNIEEVGRLFESGSYDKACSFDPAILHGETTLNLGVCYAHLGRFEEAIGCFELLKDHPRFGQAATQNASSLRGLLG